MDQEFQRVIWHAKRWGVEVRSGKPPKFEEEDGWWSSPFLNGPSFDDSFGIWLPERAIYWNTEIRTDSGATPNGLLHELAHVITGKPPDEVDEITSGMLAFEYRTSRALKLTTWRAWMQTYQVDANDSTMWLEASTRFRHKALVESFQGAVERGLLDANGKPTYRRLG